MRKKGLTIAVVATIAAGLAISPARAVVMTSGCTGTDSCTLDELINFGASITIDDVLFDGFTFVDEVTGSLPLDLGAITVTGSTTGTAVTLDFMFDPAIVLDSTSGVFVNSEFSYDAAVDGGSSRTIIQASQLFDDSDSGFTGIGGFTIGTDLDGAVPDELLIQNQDDGVILSDLEALASLTALTVSTDVRGGLILDIFAGSSLLAGFEQTFTLDGEFMPPDGGGTDIPVPGSLSLMATGLAASLLMRRRGARRRR